MKKVCVFFLFFMNFTILIGSASQFENLQSSRRIPELQAVLFKRVLKLSDGSDRVVYPTVSFEQMQGKLVREFGAGGDLVGVLYAFSYSDGTMKYFSSFPPGEDLKIVSLPNRLGDECAFEDAQGNRSSFRL